MEPQCHLTLRIDIFPTVNSDSTLSSVSASDFNVNFVGRDRVHGHNGEAAVGSRSHARGRPGREMRTYSGKHARVHTHLHANLHSDRQDKCIYAV